MKIATNETNGKGEPVLPEEIFASAKSSGFRKKLRWLINGEAKAERMTITPAMAAEMLAFNDHNRPLSAGTVSNYAAMMAAGRWHYTGEPIIFSNGRLCNGQHRLEACVRSGSSFDVLVVFGAPDGAFQFIDVGKKRTGADIFSIQGVKNASLMAAAILWVVGYEKGTIGSTARSSVPMDHESRYRAYLQHEALQDSAWVGGLFHRNKLAAPSIMVAIHYLAARKSRQQADEFFEKVGEGLGFSGKKDPAHRLHARLISNAISQEKLGRKQIAALTIKAWNAYRLGRDVGTLKFSADETFPKVI